MNIDHGLTPPLDPPDGPDVHSCPECEEDVYDGDGVCEHCDFERGPEDYDAEYLAEPVPGEPDSFGY